MAAVSHRIGWKKRLRVAGRPWTGFIIRVVRFGFVVFDEEDYAAVLVAVGDGIVRGDGFEFAVAYG